VQPAQDETPAQPERQRPVYRRRPNGVEHLASWLTTRVERRRPLLWIALVVPLVYLGLLLSTATNVTAHVVIGRATFEGWREQGRPYAQGERYLTGQEIPHLWETWVVTSMRVGLDGTGGGGWSALRVENVVEDAPSAPELQLSGLVIASGTLAMAAVGCILILTGWMLRRRPLCSFALVALGAIHALYPPLNLLLGGVLPANGSNIATLLMQSGMPWFRAAAIVSGAALLALVVGVTIVILGRQIEDTVGPLSRLRSAIIASSTALTAAFLAALRYREQGMEAFVAAAFATVACAVAGVLFVRRRRRELTVRHLPCWSWALAISCTWIAVAVSVAILLVSGLHDGISITASGS
jgi:hypothetical protein